MRILSFKTSFRWISSFIQKIRPTFTCLRFIISKKMLKLYSLSDFNAEQFDKSPFTLHEAGEDFISLLLMFQERIMFAKSVQKFLREIITSSMYTQPIQRFVMTSSQCSTQNWRISKGHSWSVAFLLWSNFSRLLLCNVGNCRDVILFHRAIIIKPSNH